MKMMRSTKRGNPRVYALAVLPFIAFFAYQLYVELPKRPEAPDVARGYIIPMEINDRPPAHYISTLDFIKTFGSVLCMFVAAWRGGAFSRKKSGNYNGYE